MAMWVITSTMVLHNLCKCVSDDPFNFPDTAAARRAAYTHLFNQAWMRARRRLARIAVSRHGHRRLASRASPSRVTPSRVTA
eukprot:80339-Rhodomonas_salina.1